MRFSVVVSVEIRLLTVPLIGYTYFLIMIVIFCALFSVRDFDDYNYYYYRSKRFNRFHYQCVYDNIIFEEVTRVEKVFGSESNDTKYRLCN